MNDMYSFESWLDHSLLNSKRYRNHLRAVDKRIYALGENCRPVRFVHGSAKITLISSAVRQVENMEARLHDELISF